MENLFEDLIPLIMSNDVAFKRWLKTIFVNNL